MREDDHSEENDDFSEKKDDLFYTSDELSELKDVGFANHLSIIIIKKSHMNYTLNHPNASVEVREFYGLIGAGNANGYNWAVQAGKGEDWIDAVYAEVIPTLKAVKT